MAKKAVTERCPWCGDDPLYQQYHDTVWGVPEHDDQTLFEFLTLEGAQAGLSWITVLRKQENYRAAFDGFDPVKVARYSDKRQQTLLQNPGIIRNRLKVASTVTNAQAFLAVQNEFGSFNDYLWAFVDGRPIINHFKTLADVPATTPLAQTLSKDLKKRGFRFVGPTIVYAFMQATGMVNDHLIGCHRHKPCAGLR